jgi:hypothetical protein
VALDAAVGALVDFSADLLRPRRVCDPALLVEQPDALDAVVLGHRLDHLLDALRPVRHHVVVDRQPDRFRNRVRAVHDLHQDVAALRLDQDEGKRDRTAECQEPGQKRDPRADRSWQQRVLTRRASPAGASRSPWLRRARTRESTASVASPL